MNVAKTLAALALARAHGLHTDHVHHPRGGPRRAATRRPARSGPALANAGLGGRGQHYARVQAQLLSQGLLRTDGGGRDTPFTDRMLAENFIRIALFDEYTRTVSGFVRARMTTSRIRKWQAPVRVGLRFGATPPVSPRGRMTARISSLLQRLSSVTGHPISAGRPRAQLLHPHRDRRRTPKHWARQIRADPARPLRLPKSAGITDMPRSTYCLVYALSDPNTGSTYTRAFAVIRAEHPDLLRLSCLHEEITQGLGLPMTALTARPSIFNDDEEFALLTPMDELMLKMLYNPALRHPA
jgi:hypothetical protein